MRHSVEEFAEELRKKFPESYNDLNDKDLVELWVKKFPEDKKILIFLKYIIKKKKHQTKIVMVLKKCLF